MSQRDFATMSRVATTVLLVAAFAACEGGAVQGARFTDAVPPPSVNPVPPQRTAELSIDVGGNKAVETLVWMQSDRDTHASQVTPDALRTAWSGTLDLVEGSNQFVVFASDPDVTKFSVRVGPFTVVRDTTPPTAPVVSAPTSPTDAAQATLTGTRAADGNLCLRLDQQPTCTEVAALDGSTTFSVTDDLVVGFNTLCFSSLDDLGNASDEVCVDIVRIPGPEISFVQPADGATVRGGSVAVIVQVTVGPGADEAVDTVLVCFDGGACQGAVRSGGTYQATLPMGSLTDASTHSISVTATNASGVATTETIDVVFSTGVIGVLSNNAAGPGRESVGAATVVDEEGRVHLFWSDACFQFAGCAVGQTTTRPYDIFHRRYALGQWTDTQVISTDSDDDDSQQPAVTLDAAGNIHIAWSDTGTIDAQDSDVAPDIVVRIMQADGTLGASTVVGHSADTDTVPQLAAAPDGTVVLVWQRLPVGANDDPEVYFSRWTPDAAESPTGSWSVPSLVSNHLDDGRSVNPAVVADSASAAWVVWQDDGDMDGADTDDDIYLRKVSGSGTLGTQVLVTTYGPESFSRNPAAIIDSSNLLHLVWVDDNPSGSSGSDNDVWYVTYDTAGASLGSKRLVSETAGGADTPAVARAGDGSIAIGWAERDGSQSEVYFRALVTGLFVTPELLSNNTDNFSINPSMSVDGSGDLHVIWEDLSEIIPADNGQGDWDIFWKVLPATDWDAVQ